MSFDLQVFFGARSFEVAQAWKRCLLERGIQIELQPSYAMHDRAGFVGVKYANGVEAGFELDVGDCDPELDRARIASGLVTVASFRTSFGRKPADLRAQWLAASTLASVTNGVLQDPQSARDARGADALSMGEQQIRILE